MFDILLGQMSEAIVRATKSYQQSMNSYQIRLSQGLQPSTPFIDLFNPSSQIAFLITMNLVYLIVTVLLVNHMKHRKRGYRLRWYLVYYDALNVILAAYIAISILRFKIGKGGGMLLCNPISNEVEALQIVPVFILFYIQKFLEFCDTWFFILRKSVKQVTFLHLFHHSSITLVVGFIFPFDYNGDMYLPIMLNSFNHAAVYLHYLLATLGIRSPWAGYITFMQLGQFVLIFLQSLVAYRIGPTCGSPDFAKLLMIVYMGSMVALFLRYFISRYIFRHPKSSLELCGVIKSPTALPSSSLLATTVQHCGTARLNDQGECHIALPDAFPDPALQLNPISNNRRFTFVYHITPLGAAMPSLYVSAEVHRWTPLPTSTSSSSSPTPVGTNSLKPNGKGPLKDEGSAQAKSSSSNKNLSEPNLAAAAERKQKPSVMTLSTGGAMVKSKSYNSLSESRHNDRLIDGPLPSILSKSVSSEFNSSNGKPAENASRDFDTSGHGGHRPLCFSIAGGLPRGRVSWMVMTVPGEDSDEAQKRSDDWRAIQ